MSETLIHGKDVGLLNKIIWEFISFWGTLVAGILLIGLAFFVDRTLGWVALVDLAIITLVSNTYKVYRFKPRPDNPEGHRPARPFRLWQVWMFLKWKNCKAYFHYVDAGSFPSIHSARSFNLAALFGFFFATPLAWIALLAGAALIGGSRVVKERHFPVDVAAGAVLGLLTAAASVSFIGG